MTDPKRKFTEIGLPAYAPWDKDICACCNMHDAETDSDFCRHCLNPQASESADIYAENFNQLCAAMAWIKDALNAPSEAEPGFVIMHNGHDPDNDEPIFWSNTDGWVSLASADVFSSKETTTLHLPVESWGWLELPGGAA